jgi:hypothetical protein
MTRKVILEITTSSEHTDNGLTMLIEQQIENHSDVQSVEVINIIEED